MTEDVSRRRYGWIPGTVALSALIIVPLTSASVRTIAFALVVLVSASWCYQARIADELNERIERLQDALDELRPLHR